MRYRVFAPPSAAFNDVYRPVSGDVEIVEIGQRCACSAPLRNDNHETCYVAECVQRDGRRRSVPPKAVLDPLGMQPWDEISIATYGQRRRRYLEVFPPVPGEKKKQVVDALGERFTGTIRRGSYPVTSNLCCRGDALMWIFEGASEIADRLRDVLDKHYHGMFALATEDDKPVATF